MSVPAIVFDSVSLDFGGRVLFQQLSFSLDRGSCTCLLGPSGCGKSTLLRLLTGNGSLPFSGTISFPGIIDHANAIAWMAQDDLLLPWMDVENNVLLGAKLRGQVTKDLRDKARHLLQEIGLQGYEHSLPATLSGGMRQRVALLRTLMEDRHILLMDEPFSALDALTRVKLQDLSSLLTRSSTVLLVTHDPHEALRMADRILVLGSEPVQVVADINLQGTPPRVADDPEVVGRYPGLLSLLMGEL